MQGTWAGSLGSSLSAENFRYNGPLPIGEDRQRCTVEQLNGKARGEEVRIARCKYEANLSLLTGESTRQITSKAPNQPEWVIIIVEFPAMIGH